MFRLPNDFPRNVLAVVSNSSSDCGSVASDSPKSFHSPGDSDLESARRVVIWPLSVARIT